MRCHLLENFNDFSKLFIPNSASVEQKLDMQVAFFAGATILLAAYEVGIETNNAEGVAVIFDEIREEIRIFSEKICPIMSQESATQMRS